MTEEENAKLRFASEILVATEVLTGIRGRIRKRFQKKGRKKKALLGGRLFLGVDPLRGLFILVES